MNIVVIFIFVVMCTCKLEVVRDEMKRKDIDGCVMYRRDTHLNEYMHPYYEHVGYISGFTGSNAVLVVLEKSAVLYTDSRYYLQAKQELSRDIEMARMGEDMTLQERLKQAAEKAQRRIRIGVNAEYITEKEYERVYAPIKEQVEVVWMDDEIVNRIWETRPEIVSTKLVVMESDVSVEEKIKAVRECMVPGKHKKSVKQKVDCVIITDMDEIAYVTNMRGNDVEMSRLYYAYMYITAEEVKLYTDSILPIELEGVEVHKYSEIHAQISTIKQKRVGVSRSTNYAISMELQQNNNEIAEFKSILDMKAIKTEEEIRGFEQSNIKDAVYLCTLFGQIQEKVDSDVEVGEIDAADMLLELKKSDSMFVVPSFDTISAYGENGAVIHYKPKDNDVKIRKNGLYLIDSGSQYDIGTTDITRTVCFGTATEKQKKHYTAVIKGHIALETIRFVEKTALGVLATIVRKEVWEVGENYGHATGHGVGYGLNVHEGPHYMEPRSEVEAEVGMVVTNEPGIYIEGEYGIRHENLMVVEKDKSKKNFLRLRNMTPVPLHIGLLDLNMLTQKEIEYINSESKRMRGLLTPHLSIYPEGLAWMHKNTEQIEV